MGHWEGGCGAVCEVWELEQCALQLLPARNLTPNGCSHKWFLGIGESWCHPSLAPLGTQPLLGWAGLYPPGALLCLWCRQSC